MTKEELELMSDYEVITIVDNFLKIYGFEEINTTNERLKFLFEMSKRIDIDIEYVYFQMSIKRLNEQEIEKLNQRIVADNQLKSELKLYYNRLLPTKTIDDNSKKRRLCLFSSKNKKRH